MDYLNPDVSMMIHIYVDLSFTANFIHLIIVDPLLLYYTCMGCVYIDVNVAFHTQKKKNREGCCVTYPILTTDQSAHSILLHIPKGYIQIQYIQMLIKG